MSPLIGDLYRNIIRDEATCVKYLQDRQLLSRDDERACVRTKDDVPCGGPLKMCERKSKKRNADGTFQKVVAYKCCRKGCQTYQSIRKGNAFFTFTDANGRCNSQLSLAETVELVWFWVHRVSVDQAVQFTGRNKKTIADWYELCRDVVVAAFGNRGKMGGPGRTVQVYETLLPGGDAGQRILMLSEARDGGNPAEKRYFLVDDLDAETVMPIIHRDVQPGTAVYTESPITYERLVQYGLSSTGKSWVHAVPASGRSSKSAAASAAAAAAVAAAAIRSDANFSAVATLTRKLQEDWWRSVHREKATIFDDFLGDLKNTFLTK